MSLMVLIQGHKIKLKTSAGMLGSPEKSSYIYPVNNDKNK